MDNYGLVSVIVPIYRVEKYLEECVESILNQTYRNLEILLVDDESPDRCGEICDRYARTDPRVRVLHLKNGGAAAARNAGLRAATGSYISFVDADDALLPRALTHMVQLLEETGADIVQCGFRNVYVNGTQPHCGGSERRVFSTTDYLRQFTEDWTCALCWDKLFRREVLKDVFFEEGHLIDDEFFTYQGAMNARTVVYDPTAVYDHRQRASSVTKNTSTIYRKNLDALDAIHKRMLDVTKRFPELKKHYESHYADYLLYYATTDRITLNTVRQIRKRLLAHTLSGKILPWRDGQRKLFLRILIFLAQPAERIFSRQKERTETSEYEFFE